MTDFNPPVTLSQLIKSCQRIEVPLIQRDYAQGRESQKDVRDDFLGALHGALVLPVGDVRLPLNLDFVYGSMESGNAPRFLPLDGQQRLTTLFLLHWYLAWRDGDLLNFKATFWDGKHSRFTYGVRPSSTEFFDVLVEFVPEGSPDNLPSLRLMLEDQSWFFLHWRSDPTIQAVLVMLEAIHERFQKTKDLYARLVDEEQRTITFHLLPLEHFGLSDDLYIKMNARGKPLTAFETFKARFEELLEGLFPTETRRAEEEELPVPVFFERRMDTRWTDLFWSHQKSTFDNAAMNLVLALIRVSLDPVSPQFSIDTTSLGGRTLGTSFTTLNDRGWLTSRFANHLMDLLEAWSVGGGELTPQLPNTSHFDEAAFFRRAIVDPAALKYLELVKFAALVLYLSQYRNSVQKDGLREWMRVISNLATNSDIERPEQFGRSLAGLESLVPHANRILEYLDESEVEPAGFSPQQIREETLKAALIRSRLGWREHIETAESHGYFQGQIEFLLKFSGVLDRWINEKEIIWSDAEDIEYQRSFSSYFAKSAAVFSAHGLNEFGENRWERALLMKGDYLLKRGLNQCFLGGAESDVSWKRLLRGSTRSDPVAEQKRQYVRELLDEVDLLKGVKESLDVVLSKSVSVEPWRRAVIDQPETIGFCLGRMVRRHPDGNIYLMRRAQMNGEHAELFTYALRFGLLSKMHRLGELKPFGAPQYLPVNSEAEDPCTHLQWKHEKGIVDLYIKYRFNAFLLELSSKGGPLPDPLIRQLVIDAGFTESEGDGLIREVKNAAIEAALNELMSAFRLSLSSEGSE
jgi:hypothetical protein